MTTLKELPLACVVCSAALPDSAGGGLRCLSCGQIYPAVHGLIDLRHPARGARGEDAIAEKMLVNFDTASFEELVNLYFAALPAQPSAFQPQVQIYKQYKLDQVERGQKFAMMFLAEAQQQFGLTGRHAALDMGCGSGAGLIELSRHFEVVVGIDPSLPSLLMGQKALSERNIHNVRLFRGFAQNIPFPRATFDFIVAQNTLEHVFELEPVVSETHRVLARGGVFVADSRNRFDLFFPEPHTGLRWVGCLPRGWAMRYVAWRTGVPYDHTWLLSYADLNQAMRRHFGDSNYRIKLPDIGAYGYSARVGRLLRALERIPGLRRLMLWFFPSHLVVSRKAA
jgi:ubiquinone/menaquinone biosynthesis C-methylase UbiE